MRIGVHANPNKPKALDLARHLRTLVGDRAEVVASTETAEIVPELKHESEPLARLQVDALVALGGDGTFLYALQRSTAPLLPVNAGTVGFLAEVDGDNKVAFDGAIERLLRGHYFREERMRIATQVGGTPLADATNEVVIHTSQVAKMRLFEIGIDRKPAGRLRADGVIVATPTGSTSYAMSALGPVIEPTLEALVITALAPFQTAPRAVLVEPAHTITVRLVTPDKDGVVVVDGQSETRLPGGSEVVCYRSPRKAVFVRFASRYFPRLYGTRILPWGVTGSERDNSEEPNVPAHP
ncbi:MAG: NAD(+)/NADH kinase [Thermoplasmata archaeon]|nr:NAD(+)/NADH kinase [Thermoplasmata archaeon]